MSTKFTTISPKILSQAILSSATTFIPNNILGWDGVALTSADFGTQAFGAFLSPDRSILELFEWDPATVASTSLSILYRGLKFDGTQTTEVAGNKKDWPAGTTIQLGSDIPQLMSLCAVLGNAQTFSALNTFTLLPISNGGNATIGTQLVTYAQALAMATGTANINRIVVAGNGGEVITAGQLLYLFVTDGEWYKCDADTAASVDNIILGIAQGAGTDGGAITSGILLFGLDSNQTGLTTNTAYYASNTAGGISTTPGTTEVSVGISRSTTSLLFYPRYNQQLTEGQQDALLGNNTDIAVGSGNLFVTQTGLQKQAEQYAASAAGTDTYAITLSPIPTSYVNGMTLRFKADVANTGAATLNVNSLGAIALVTSVGTALATGDIVANQIVEVIYNSTGPVFELINPASASLITPVRGQGQTSRASASGTGTQTIAHGLGRIPTLIILYCTWKYQTGGGYGMTGNCFGTATSTSNETCTFQSVVSSGTGSYSGQNNAAIIDIGASDFIATLSALDTTNITLDFTTVTNGTVYIQWTAYA